MFSIQATDKTFPGAVFFMSAGFSFIALLMSIGVHLSLGGKRFSEVVRNEEDLSKDEKEFGDEPRVGFFEDKPPAYDDIFVSHI